MERQSIRVLILWVMLLTVAAGFAAFTEAHPILGQTDVMIDVGHGGIDSGTKYGNLDEKDLNLQIAKLTYENLHKQGLAVLINRVDDYALSDENKWLRSYSRHRKDLAQRTHLANEVKPKAVISLHINWSPKPYKKGPLVLYQRNPQSILLAQLLQKQLNDACGTSELPVYGKPYYLLNHSKAPSVIVELGFITNEEDRTRLTTPQGQRLLADRIAAGVRQYLILKNR
ncbi:N-acetylmuramoyl-L-alanine amidase family protein [Paenibacillus hamazuiensis]|uniref:N-acetylmuramoyl-L-alanine amidase family protein n=1 Tax=Paenibacillus hamazuiensis TaxID=2936508 RepID=UPI00200EB35B|nr:N-acetylmuramoyl-L-alanine amidase [Paenibacillus hamazuiensis]